MQRSGRSAPAVSDHHDLAELLRHDGPFLTVWAARPGMTPNEIASRVQSVRDTDAGAFGDVLLGQVAGAVDSAFPAAAGVVVVADPSSVLLTDALPEPPRAELERIGSVPSLAAVIEHRQASIPFVIVVADRRGSDLYWSGADGSGRTSVEGDDTFITKVQAGGWSHRTFQQRAENSWEHTADEIAAALQRVVDHVHPRVVMAAGDVRMMQILRDRLPSSLVHLVRDLPGGRSEDGSDEAREAAVRRWIKTAIAEDTVAVLRLFDQERGQQDRAADGAEPTLAALREARVDTLLVHDGADAAVPAFFVPDEPSLVATDPQVLAGLGRRDVRQGRAVDVAIRAAVLTGAGIRVVPGTPRIADGLGAVLRW
jgi:hypothetical protein